MALDAKALAARISSESGLEFSGDGGMTADGTHTFRLQPAHHPPMHTFTLLAKVGWRSIDVVFRPGNFSGELIYAMGLVDKSGRTGFVSVLRSCQENGAQIVLVVNGDVRDFGDSSIWEVAWQNMTISMRKGMLPINQGDEAADEDLIATWVGRLSAAILAILPLEEDEAPELGNASEVLSGMPEGAKLVVTVNRYERDRRNRAAALAIHGHVCKACDTDMGYRYGAVAAGLIEVHHTTPVSRLGPNYIIDPKTDLLPLCPNCHAVAHRRLEPYSVEELRGFLFGGRAG